MIRRIIYSVLGFLYGLMSLVGIHELLYQAKGDINSFMGSSVLGIGILIAVYDLSHTGDIKIQRRIERMIAFQFTIAILLLIGISSSFGITIMTLFSFIIVAISCPIVLWIFGITYYLGYSQALIVFICFVFTEFLVFKLATKKLGHLPIILLVVGVTLLAFTTPIEQKLVLKQEGIEFNKDKIGGEKIIPIMINGKYKATVLGNRDEFMGTMMIGDRKFEFKSYPLIFNHEGMATLDIAPFTSADSMFGAIYVNRNMEKIIIEEFSELDHGVSQNNGWVIVTPARTTGQATKIAKELTRRVGRNLLD